MSAFVRCKCCGMEHSCFSVPLSCHNFIALHYAFTQLLSRLKDEEWKRQEGSDLACDLITIERELEETLL